MQNKNTMTSRNEILQINAHLKYIEYLLNIFDNESDQISLKEIKNKFKEKFKTEPVLLNQYFGIVRLLPLLLMKETYKNLKKELAGDVEKIKIIRDAIAHHSFSIDENGYNFKNDKQELFFTYDEFQSFLHRIENDFYVSV